MGGGERSQQCMRGFDVAGIFQHLRLNDMQAQIAGSGANGALQIGERHRDFA